MGPEPGRGAPAGGIFIMAIQSLELSNIGPFRARPDTGAADGTGIRVEFDDDVNLFVGPNNSGKSTVLQAVNLLTQHWTPLFLRRYIQFAGFPPDHHAAAVAINWRNDQGSQFRFQTDYGVLSRVMGKIAQTGYGTASDDRVGDIVHPTPAAAVENCTYAEWDKLKSDGFGYAIFVTYTNYRLDILSETEDLAHFQWGSDKLDQDVITTLHSVLARITREFPIEINNIEHSSAYGWVVNTQTIDGLVLASELSLGTQYVLGWIVRLVVGFARRYSGDSSWRNRSGMFIIDDIDAHLHPSWQRRIIPTLKEYFPNVQIFASAHSPLMVAGLKTGQVHLLNRDTTGTVTWSRNESDIIGWTADEIYRTFMGVDDPTDYRTASHAEELRELRSKYHRTPSEEARLQELRRLGNEDLLAGGRINAQRERFDAMMQDYLRSRMSDSSQEGER